jgi:hypothetical protein
VQPDEARRSDHVENSGREAHEHPGRKPLTESG